MAFEKHIYRGTATSNLDMDTYTLLFADGSNIARSGASEITVTGDLVVTGDLSGYSTDSGVATLTNKTIDGDNNTITNLDIGNEVDWAAAGDVADRSAFASGDKMLIFEDGVGLRKIDYDDLPGAAGIGNAYANIFDGTTTSNAVGSDTFKLRSSDGSIDIVVQNDDATHNDNANFTLATGGAALSVIADQAAWTILVRNAGTSGAVSAAALADITEEASPATGDFVVGFLDTGEIRKYDIANLPTSGQNNTASNVGVGGVGVWKQKVGVDLQFKNLNVGSNKISVTDDPGNNEIDIDLVPANVLISELNNDSNFTSNPDAIESSVAGEINAITTKGTPTSSDILLIEDAADSFNKKKITISSLPAVPTVDSVDNTILANMAQDTIKGRITAGTGDPEDLTATQVRTLINVEDGSTANPNAVETDAADEFSGLTEESSPAADDLLLLEDTSNAGAKRKVTVANLQTATPTITVEESDGFPSIACNTLEFNQADGFQLTDEGGGRMRVDMEPTIHVTESDGLPLVDASILEFNQADGFSVVDEGGGIARVDFDGIDCGTLP